jgi:hypothetical protein
MNVNDPQFESYQSAFFALADQAKVAQKPIPSADQCLFTFFFLGENGLSPSEEFELLNQMSAYAPDHLYRLEIDTPIYQDTLLYVWISSSPLN